MTDEGDFYANQILELRRGTIVLAILAHLRTPQYGYGLLQRLENSRIPIDAGTLYPLLRRLERQGVLESSWQTSGSRPRKYYQLSSRGEALYGELVAEWQLMTKSIMTMIGDTA